MSTKRAIDRANLDRALTLIREAYPHAIGACFQTSDQGNYGFVHEELVYPDRLEYVHDEDQHADQIAELLSDLDWDGVMGEDAHGCVTIDLTVGE